MNKRRTVVIMGGASGIGLAMVQAFLEEGDQVHACDVQGTDELPVGVEFHHVDVTDESAMAETFEAITSSSGRLDVVCNNAGIGSTTSVLDATSEEFDRVMAVNAKGVFLGTKLATECMLRQGHGVIINTASAAALVGVPDRLSYSASKGAVIALSRQVAAQYAGTGIRCVWINPGTVNSPWVGRLLGGTDDPDALRSQLVARQPMGRLGEPEEIAAAAIYLASDSAGFMTGVGLTIDGGITAR